jgi:ribosomal protein S16
MIEESQLPELSWSLAGTWNDSLLNRTERPQKIRDYVWASEMGGPMIDRYLKMNGVPPTNPPNARSLRKFEAGNLFEWILEFVLKRAGILLESQEWINHKYPKMLRVTGKLDFIAGGQPDWERSRHEVSSIGLPEMLSRASLAIVDHLEGIYGTDALKTIILEAKSISSFMMDRYEVTGQANPNHRCQLFHYLKGKNMREGHVVYICRDDCRMLELGVFNPSQVETEYKKDLEEITYYIENQTEPRKESEVLFDESVFSFQKNWKVEYSNYLTKLYGFEEPIHYREKWDKPVAAMNRVFKRCVTGAKMTDLNLKVIEGAKRHFPNWDDLVDKAKAAAAKNPKLIELTEEAA